MKKILNQLFILSFVVAILASCKKDENKNYFTGGTTPVLTASSMSPIVLNSANATNTAVTFSWTNPNYYFTTGISSQDVNYILQVDTVGSNFTNPNLQEIGIAKDTSLAIPVAQINLALVKLLAGHGLYHPHNIDIRVKSTLTSGSVPLYSNDLKIVMTPYLAFSVRPPGTLASGYSDGNLYIVGSAVAGGWNNPIASANIAAQTFMKQSATLYTVTIPLIGNGEYKLIGVNGSWNDQWSVATTDTYPNGGPFVYNGNNSIAPSASGTYTITVDFLLGTFTVQ